MDSTHGCYISTLAFCTPSWARRRRPGKTRAYVSHVSLASLLVFLMLLRWGLLSITKSNLTMKRILTVLLFVVAATAGAMAQEYQAFRVGIGMGYAMASGSGSKGGILVNVEPGYRVTDQILLNLRVEAAVVGRGFANEVGAEIDVAAIASYTLNGQYYFNNNKFRPFVGAGFGTYSLASTSVSVDMGGGQTETGVLAAANKFGFYPRVGFDSGHFTLALDYNILPETYGIKNSYVGIRVGGFFGGGKK